MRAGELCRVQLGEAPEERRVDARGRGGALDRPRLRALAQLLGAARVLAKERLVGVSVFEEIPMHGERERDVGARTGSMDVRQPGQRRRPRIDDDERGAALLGLAHVGHEVNARGRGIDAPQHDQRRVRIILVGDRRHLAVERQVGGAGRRRADRPRQARRAEPPPQLRVEVVLRQQSVRAAVRIRQNRRAAVLGFGTTEPIDRRARALRPADALERAVAFRSDARSPGYSRIRSAPVDALAELADLRADEAAGDRILLRAVDLDDLAAVDGDGERAGIGTIERARGLRRPGRRGPRCRDS